MELIATARFKKAMDRSVAARDYTLQLAKILENIAAVGEDLSHLYSKPGPLSEVLFLFSLGIAACVAGTTPIL